MPHQLFLIVKRPCQSCDMERRYSMPKKSKNKKVKRRRLGWKKSGIDGYVYVFMPTVAKKFNIKKIEFIGFKTRPTGLSLLGSGGGFNMRQANKVGGGHFLSYLSDKFKKRIKLVIFSATQKKPVFKIQKATLKVVISIENFKELLKDLGDDIREKRGEAVENRLRKYYENEFKKIGKTQESTNTKLKNISFKSLDKNDHVAILDFIKKYLAHNAGNKISDNLFLKLGIEGKKKTLLQVIKKFESHINDKAFDEKKWQKFLHEEVFFFISNYIESIREVNVNLSKADEGEKKPDFVWIDLYGFLDVFEIKTPFTDILAKRIDKSHKNYYFSSEASKAISQVEKYILFLENNVDKYEKELSKQTLLPFTALKPKAFLIIGNSEEFEKNPHKKKDFRVLRRLFKNIEFITFNELLDNLRNLTKKFEKEDS
jgi:hypothetical protein